MRYASLIALAFLFSASTASAASPILSAEDYFFVGGHYVEEGGKRFMTGQMYVQHLAPAKVTRH